MAKAKVEIKGGLGVVLLVIAIGIASFRFMTRNEVTDIHLKKDLMIRLGGTGNEGILDALQNSGSGNDELEVSGLEIAKPTIKFESIMISAPLLKWTNNKDVIVKVRFSSKSGKTELKYFRYIQRGLSSWEYRGVAPASSYYLNFF